MNHRHANNPRGFTLVELMISVAIALLLIVGVSQVFKLSGDTAGATAALGNMTRDFRAAQSTFVEDFRNSSVDSPLFLISSGIAYPSATTTDELIPEGNIKRGVRAGFRNLQDQQSALDPNDPTKFEINGTPYTAKVASLSDRMPRLDRLAFFTRNFYRSQAPRDGTVTRNINSSEAFIWYGHLGVLGFGAQQTGGQKWPSSFSTVMQVPERGNGMRIPENQFANERVLGRATILLKDATELQAMDPSLTEFKASIGGGPNDLVQPNPGDRFPPLDYLGSNFMNSRYDVAATTIDDLRQKMGVRYNNHKLDWYDVLEDRPVPTFGPETWFFRIGHQPRFNRPVTAQSLSQLVPYFIGNCTQFVVEYAGDYICQGDNPANPDYGKIVNGPTGKRGAGAWVKDPNSFDVEKGETDGVVDFIVDKSANATGPADPTKWVKRVRWYGLPRDVNGDGVIDVDNDVVPLADVYGTANPALPTSAGPAFAPWERKLPAYPAPGDSDYMKLQVNQAPGFRYVCAWHNDAPLMIRISVKIDDPAHRVQDGQWQEFVLSR